jgi:hypothetical protein
MYNKLIFDNLDLVCIYCRALKELNVHEAYYITCDGSLLKRQYHYLFIVSNILIPVSRTFAKNKKSTYTLLIDMLCLF